MKNSDDTIENRTRDFPACGALPQPTAPPRAPFSDKRQPKSRPCYEQYHIGLLITQAATKSVTADVTMQSKVTYCKTTHSRWLCHIRGLEL